MAEVTEADREKARDLARDLLNGKLTPRDMADPIAAALAEEREKARAPFLALADDLRLEASEQEAWDGNCVAAYEEISDRIRRAAEETA